MTRENIITELQKRGYNVEPETVTKNGVECRGIIFKDGGRIAPVIYTDEIIRDAEEKNTSLDVVVNSIIEIYEAHRAPVIDFNEIMTDQYIGEHIKIGLQRATNEEIIKRPFELDSNVEEYLYITINTGSDSAGSAKIKPDMLASIGMEPATAWSHAKENTCNDITVEDMSVLLGAEAEKDPASPTMLVISNHDKVKGAAAILDRKTLEKIGKDYDTNEIIIIPSSIHECIVIPHTKHIDINEITSMVIEVNKSVVNPVDQLGDRAYIVTL